jgi:hypothetical protein
MLAARRNDRVSGRTRILDVSINTRNGLSQSGAPSGRRWATEAFTFFENLDITILSHMGSPIVSVKIRCLEALSMYGSRPRRLINIISIKIEVAMVLIPFKSVDWVRASCEKIIFCNIF